jgi:hypothetical protein
LFTLSVDHHPQRANRGDVVEEFLALLAVQLLVLVAERIVKFVSESWMPAT